MYIYYIRTSLYIYPISIIYIYISSYLFIKSMPCFIKLVSILFVFCANLTQFLRPFHREEKPRPCQPPMELKASTLPGALDITTLPRFRTGRHRHSTRNQEIEGNSHPPTPKKKTIQILRIYVSWFKKEVE